MKRKVLMIIIALVLIVTVALSISLLVFKSGKEVSNPPEYVLLYAENQIENYPTTQGHIALRIWYMRKRVAG